MKLICLDIEATDKGEMLELSTFRFEDSKEIYHSYFKPVRAKTWLEEPHHITPDMVKDAPRLDSERAEIQRILNEADGIVGFALDNDINYLKRHNIRIPQRLISLEVKEWFWYYVGKEADIKFDSVPKLSKCAQLLDFQFSEETDAHSATNDTEMTLNIFKKVLDKGGVGELTLRTIAAFDEAYRKEQAIYAQTIAKGILTLILTPKGYVIRNNRYDDEKKQELSIVVDSRFAAEHEIRQKFKKRASSTDSMVYNLRPSDIEYFMNYTNVYDAERENVCRQIYNTKRSKNRNLSFRLS